MAAVEFLQARIGVDGTTVLRDVDLDIADGEFLGVIGPSGCGKSTLLRAVAGFSDIESGTLTLDGVDMVDVKVADRDVAMVFQNPVLLPHRSVARNVAFPLEIRRRDIEEIRQRVGAEVRALHFEHLLGRRPKSLSRGEAQLVQIARAMVRTPSVLLLDEPLATLDDVTRRRMRSELPILQQGYGVTTILATNDGLDAMQMVSRLAVIAAGRVVQVGTPIEVRRHPATLDAAYTTGDCSTIPARVDADGDGYWLVGPDRAFRHRSWSPALADRVGDEVVVGIRPDDVDVTPTGAVRAVVDRVVPGPTTHIFCRVGGHRVGVETTAPVAVGDSIGLHLDHLVVFDPTSGFAIA